MSCSFINIWKFFPTNSSLLETTLLLIFRIWLLLHVQLEMREKIHTKNSGKYCQHVNGVKSKHWNLHKMLISMQKTLKSKFEQCVLGENSRCALIQMTFEASMESSVKKRKKNWLTYQFFDVNSVNDTISN